MKKKLFLGLLIIASTPIPVHSSLGPLTSFIPKFDSFEEINNFSLRLEKQLAALSEDKNKIEAQQATLKLKAEQLNKDILQLKVKVQGLDNGEKNFYAKKLTIINQTYQTVTEMEQLIQQIINLIDMHTKLLQEYKQDPEFRHKNLTLPPKSLYTFADLQKINDLMLTYEGELKELDEKAKKIQQDIATREKALTIASQEYAEKKKAQEEFSIKAQEESQGLSLSQKAELIDDEEELYRYKKELTQLRLKEVEQRRNLLIDTQIKTVRLQLNILKKEYEDVKSRLQVDEKYKNQVDVDYKKEEQEFQARRKKFREHIEGLDTARTSLEEKLNDYKKQFNISPDDLESIKQWDLQSNSVQGWAAFLAPQVVLRKIHEAAIRKHELEAQIELERVKLRQLEATKSVIDTWHALTVKRTDIDTQEEVTREIKHYERMRDDIQAAIASLSEKRAIAGANLNTNSNIVEKIKARMKELEKQKETIFKGYENEYERDYSRLKTAIDDIRAFGEPLARIVELYSQAQEISNNTLHKIDSILAELQASALSKGSPGALLKSLKDFFPDIQRFFKVTYTVVSNFFKDIKNTSIRSYIDYYTENPLQILYLISQLLIILLLFWFLKLYVPYFRSSLLPAALSSDNSIGKLLSQILYVFCGFIYKYLLPLYCWAIGFIGVKTVGMQEPALRISFYLASIPFLIYYARKFVSYLTKANREHDYTLISKYYAQRMINIFGLLMYATVLLQLFREAFMVVNYHKSTVPAILQALNFALFQLAIIALLGRNEVLSMIPQKNSWQKVYDFVNRYYYLLLLLVVIIVFMSNPYIGYGPYFLRILSRVVLIALLIPIFSAIHAQVKRLSNNLFFQYDNDVIKDRFPYAKTAYGLFVITSFGFFVIIAVFIALHIWGYSISWRDISGWLHKELYSAGIDASGRPIIIEPLNFIKLFLYFLSGLATAYIFNRFILRRAFELLLVNIGVQNALMSLARYIIVIAFTVVGFQAVGMGSALLYIFAVIGALGYAAKEIVTDFIAYIIILVQRFVKIGDFIQLDENTRGVVRHINFRSVVLRKKNSVTVIIPNNYFINRQVTNWNYSRTFFAFDDILLVVPYTSDPQKVKEVIQKTLSSNLNILKTPSPFINLRDFVENGFQFLIRGFMSPEKVLDQFDIASDIRMELVRNLREVGIQIATPVRTIKLVQEPVNQDGNTQNNI